MAKSQAQIVDPFADDQGAGVSKSAPKTPKIVDPFETKKPAKASQSIVDPFAQDKPQSSVSFPEPEQPQAKNKEDTNSGMGFGEAAMASARNLPDVFKQNVGGLMRMAGEIENQYDDLPAGRTREMVARERALPPAEQKEAARKRAEPNVLSVQGKEVADEARKSIEQNMPELEPGSTPYYAYHGTTTLGLMAPSVIATILTGNPGVGAAMFAPVIAGTEYDEARESGRTVDEATLDTTVKTAAESLSEMLPLGTLTKAGGRYLWRVGKSGLSEGIQETVNEGFNMLYDYGVIGESTSPADLQRRLMDAFVLGSGVGTMFGIPGQMVNPGAKAERESTDEDISGEVDPTQSIFDTDEAAGEEELAEQMVQEFPERDTEPGGGEDGVSGLDLTGSAVDEEVDLAGGVMGDEEIKVDEAEEIDLSGADTLDTEGMLEIETADEVAPETELESPEAVQEPTVKEGLRPEEVDRAVAALESELEQPEIVDPFAGEAEDAQLAPEAIQVEEVEPEAITIQEPESAEELDAQATQAAESPETDTPAPTEAQKKAGNYKKGKVRLHGMDISIENPRGSTRRGTRRTGEKWSQTMKDHYGYIRGTKGRDKDHIDVFVTKDAYKTDRPVFVVDQVNPDGAFDEHKVIMGAANEKQAKRVYKRNYGKGWQGLGAIKKMSPQEFKDWTKGDTTKPVALPVAEKRTSVAKKGTAEPDTEILHSRRGASTAQQKRDRMGMDFEDLPGDPEGSQTRPKTPVDEEPETVAPEKARENLKDQGFDKPNTETAELKVATGTYSRIEPLEFGSVQDAISVSRETRETHADQFVVENSEVASDVSKSGARQGFQIYALNDNERLSLLSVIDRLKQIGMPASVFSEPDVLMSMSSRRSGGMHINIKDGPQAKRTAIVINQMFMGAKIGSQGRSEMYEVVAHEFGHAMDYSKMNGEFLSVNSPLFRIDDGAFYEKDGHPMVNEQGLGPVMRELITVYVNNEGSLQKYLSYPFIEINKYTKQKGVKKRLQKAKLMQQEAFAQAVSLYYNHPERLRKAAPQTYSFLTEVHNAYSTDATPAQRHRALRKAFQYGASDARREAAGGIAASDQRGARKERARSRLGADERNSGDIVRALQKIADEKGYDSALIHELHQRVGGPLAGLKDTLAAMAEKGQVVLDVGDASLSTPEEQAAAIDIRGEPHHRVRVGPRAVDIQESREPRPEAGLSTSETVNEAEQRIRQQHGLQTFSLSERDGDIVLNNMVVDEKGRGVGTAAMQDLVEYADQIGRRILLTPGKRADQTGTTSTTRLKRFYKRFGFVENKDRNRDFEISEGMYRDPEQVNVTETEAFKRWFGDSKVVDENGEPLVVYHGTAQEDFTEFKPDRAGEVQYSDWGPGIYLTPSEDQAYRYRIEAMKEGDETSNAAFARLEAAQSKQEWKNGAPVQNDEVDAALAEFRRARRAAGEQNGGRIIPAYVSLQNPYIQEATSTANPAVGKMAREQGHDGIIVLKPDGSIDEVVAFQSEQIKSVNNRGTFDPTDANILHSEQGGVPEQVPRTEFSEKNRKLREQDQKTWKRAKRMLRRQLSPGGLLPKSVFREKITRDSKFEVIEFDVRHIVGNFERAIRRAYKRRAGKLTEGDKKILSDALAGKEMPEGLKPEVKSAVTAMRSYIDKLSREYVQILDRQVADMRSQFDEGRQILFDAFMAMQEIVPASNKPSDKAKATRRRNDILAQAKEQAKESWGNGKQMQQALVEVNDAASRASLLKTVSGNVGKYVHRSYQAFDDPNWINNVPESVLDNARVYLAERNEDRAENLERNAQELFELGQLEEGNKRWEKAKELRENADTIVERQMNEILKVGTAFDSMEAFIKEGKLGRMDMSVLQHRKEIPKAIRDLLGEYNDPRVNFANSATKMGRLIWNQRFLEKIQEVGEGTFLWRSDDESRPAEAYVEIAPDSASNYEPLSGYYTYPEVEQAFRDALGKEQMANWYRWIVQLNGMVKYGKTVLSPTTAMRNWQSAAFFALANGHVNWRHAGKSFSGMREYFTQMGKGEQLKYLRKLKELGVVYDTPYAGEMMRLLDDSKMSDRLLSGTGQMAWGDAMQYATKFYQFGDDFWKIIGFENEKALLMKHANMSEKDAEVEAAERIRNTYPTYSMVGRFIQNLRRFPVVGTFVSFPAEIIRTSANMVRYVHKDWNTPGMRPIAVRRAMGLTAVAAFAHAMQALTKAWFDVDDDEEEALRIMAAPWSKNSNILFTGRDEDGNLTYFDLSFLDPYNIWKRPVTAAIRDAPWEDRLTSALDDTVGPFLGTDIGFGAVSEVVYNKRNDTGGPVFQEHDLPWDQAEDIITHITKSIQPGLTSNLYRTWQALEGTKRPSGRPYKLEEELLAWGGWRASTLDPKVSVKYLAYEFGDQKRAASTKLSRVLRDPNEVSDAEIKDAVRDSLKLRNEAYEDMVRVISAAKKTGATERQIEDSLRSSNVAIKDIRSMLRGRWPRYELSKASQKYALRTAQALYGNEQENELIRRYNLARDAIREREEDRESAE